MLVLRRSPWGASGMPGSWIGFIANQPQNQQCVLWRTRKRHTNPVFTTATLKRDSRKGISIRTDFWTENDLERSLLILTGS
jgi:hypothetical protein